MKQSMALLILSIILSPISSFADDSGSQTCYYQYTCASFAQTGCEPYTGTDACITDNDCTKYGAGVVAYRCKMTEEDCTDLNNMNPPKENDCCNMKGETCT